MNETHTCDVAIIGGGLAGLSAAILLARAGHAVIVAEKEAYPHHKVCGEYISMESFRFLQSLGIDLEALHLPRIGRLVLTAPGGGSFHTRLPLGGFGWSRHALDSALANEARRAGVKLMERATVEHVGLEKGQYLLSLRTPTGPAQIGARLAAGAWGKRSNLDLRTDRAFLKQHDKRLNNWVGIKYHVRADWPADTIGLHNFRNGYCGISKIEADRYCLCYLVRADELRGSGGIPELEHSVLRRNPQLASVLDRVQRVDGFPVAISQISFASKTQTEGGVLLLGDAAGMITPLCGNGMSIALHTGQIAAGLISTHLKAGGQEDTLQRQYGKAWQKQFQQRLRTGRILQWFFGAERTSDLFVATFRRLPFLARPLIRMTHGREIPVAPVGSPHLQKAEQPL